ncbi:MAG: DUF3334 family protein [SAR324 cluster bacterium]|nr:DUF3334 family protein [SAR324 cluster bacterium]
MAVQRKKNTVDAVSQIFGQATKQIVGGASGVEVYFAPTIQKIAGIHLKPDIGCFVQFSGDYSGLVIINFSRDAAMDFYRQSMLFMGLPEDELAIDHTADDVVDCIGEMVNQLVGKARLLVQEQYGLSAYNSQPKAICLMESVSLSIDSLATQKNQCRRLSFRMSGKFPFHIEIFLEYTEFIVVDPVRLDGDDTPKGQPDIEALMTQGGGTPAQPDMDALMGGGNSEAAQPDIEALMAQGGGTPAQPDMDALMQGTATEEKEPEKKSGGAPSQSDIDALFD